ncbi:oligo-1,6-glucosidase [Halobellus salinus]|uniref:Oligo-1,6-glucosidase n=1 Tax=Halobellus salinus TaxID=931585 RepID=A0A830EFC2_9EURY|nr:alpha-glucosidase [Halobellus salinus]GGJ06424.1 oligo-1,6-glucosidase [Halobellus salinus]SMP14675.1 oligo-1,6-glucosidase/alpha-glucosidase [Halobellus salinus]
MSELPWWKNAVVYQIYPRSFNDSDGDGVGDIPGIIERLDHLDDLGIDAVWLSPVYESPQHDNGYDVSDYRAIHSGFGTTADWERLLEGLHDRDIRLVMDMVANHTSSEHEWFRQSRSTPEGEHGDYYVWREGDPEAPPNNWESAFGGSAWEYDDERGAWYLHLFDTNQPDLNWRNPRVREEIYDVMNWWLEKGVDGYRLDVVNLLSKAEGLPDGDPSGEWVGSEHFVDGPRIFEYLGEMHDEVFAGTDTVSVGEMPQLDLETASEYTGDGPLDLVFPFEHVELDFGDRGRWDIGEWRLPELKSILDRWQRGLDEEWWTTLFFENHDQPRSVSRFGDDERYRYESATALATIILTLRGTPFVYQGQEIGMTNSTFASLDDVADVDSVRNVRELIDGGVVKDYDAIRHVVEYRSRDNARTPVQWDDSPNAGFTDGDPWLPVNDDYPEVNVARERSESPSVLAYYRRLIELRASTPPLVSGRYNLHYPDDEQLFVYTRTGDNRRVVVVINFSADDRAIDLGPLDGSASLLLGNHEDVPESPDGAVDLRPYEARLYETEPRGSGPSESP